MRHIHSKKWKGRATSQSAIIKLHLHIVKDDNMSRKQIYKTYLRTKLERSLLTASIINYICIYQNAYNNNKFGTAQQELEVAASSREDEVSRQ